MEDEITPVAKPSLSERFTRLLANPASLKPAAPADPTNEAERKALVRFLDATERRYGLIAAGLSLVIGLFITFSVQLGILPSTAVPTGKPPVCNSGYDLQMVSGKASCVLNTHTPVNTTQLVFLLILSAAIGFAVYSKRRSILATTTLLAGMAYGILGIPFIALGGWLLVRAWRVQRFGTTSAREAAQSARQPRAQREGSRRNFRAAKAAEAASSSKIAPPTPSKRYTPPKPTGKRPKPPTA